MNAWTAPIPIAELEEKMSNDLYLLSPKYGVLFDIAIETGVMASSLLLCKVSDYERPVLSVYAKKNSRQSYELSTGVATKLSELTVGKNQDDYIFTASDGKSPLSRMTFVHVLQRVAADYHLKDISITSLRKTYLLHIYKEHGIKMVCDLLSIQSHDRVKDFLGIDKGIVTSSIRAELLTNSYAKDRIDSIKEDLTAIQAQLYNPITPDEFYNNLQIDMRLIEQILEKYQGFINSGTTAENS